MTKHEFDEKVFLVCVKYDCSERSGYRTKQRNHSVGGHPNSRHTIGLGKDIVSDRDLPEGWEQVHDECERQGLVAVIESDHIHVQSR